MSSFAAEAVDLDRGTTPNAARRRPVSAKRASVDLDRGTTAKRGAPSRFLRSGRRWCGSLTHATDHPRRKILFDALG